jgi:hypothetical protein
MTAAAFLFVQEKLKNVENPTFLIKPQQFCRFPYSFTECRCGQRPHPENKDPDHPDFWSILPEDRA